MIIGDTRPENLAYYEATDIEGGIVHFNSEDEGLAAFMTCRDHAKMPFAIHYRPSTEEKVGYVIWNQIHDGLSESL